MKTWKESSLGFNHPKLQIPAKNLRDNLRKKMRKKSAENKVKGLSFHDISRAETGVCSEEDKVGVQFQKIQTNNSVTGSWQGPNIPSALNHTPVKSWKQGRMANSMREEKTAREVTEVESPS